MPKPECSPDKPFPKLGLFDRISKAYDRWYNGLEIDESYVSEDNDIFNADDAEVHNGCRFL